MNARQSTPNLITWTRYRHGKLKRGFLKDEDWKRADTSSAIPYTELTSGSWAVVIDAPEHEFTFQRQFNLTIGERNDNTVYETVRKPLSV